MGVMERVKAPAAKQRTPKAIPADLPLDSILQGELAPAAKLIVAELGVGLVVSRGPVREVFRMPVSASSK